MSYFFTALKYNVLGKFGFTADGFKEPAKNAEAEMFEKIFISHFIKYNSGIIFYK